MNHDFEELVRVARRALRRAAGQPITPEEEAEERRKKEIEALELYIHRRLQIEGVMRLNATVVWGNEGTFVRMNVGDSMFHLRKDARAYVLYAVKDGERELIRIEGTHPHFGSVLIVAVADSLHGDS
jgi:hypothetical protein